LKKVLLRGPILSRSGYGVHARQVFRYLLTVPDIEISVGLLPWGITPWYLNPEDENGLIGEILKRQISIDENTKKFDVSIQVQLPYEWDPTLAKTNVGITAAIETTCANPTWTSVHCEKMDLVIVPSEHAKTSLTNAGKTLTPIKVVPESFYDEVIKEPKQKLDLNLESKFNFLTVGVLTGNTPDSDRKNLFYLIKWFVEEFKNDPDVGLIVKTNRGRETTIDRQGTKAMLTKLLNEIGHKGTPKIYFMHGQMSREEMTALYKDDRVKAFVSATRGEGFGLPHLEAAAAALPVIATNWSAHKEFLDLGKWIKVDYDLIDVHPSKIDNNIFVKGMKWAHPKEKELKKALRNFYKKPEMPKNWSVSLEKKIHDNYSFKAVRKRYHELLEEVLN